MEPSYWYAPVNRTLGALLLRQGRASEAEVAFEAELAQTLKDGWAQWGLGRARVLIDSAGPRVDEAYDAFMSFWRGPVLPRLISFVGGRHRQILGDWLAAQTDACRGRVRAISPDETL